jgi:hypothetical protein
MVRTHIGETNVEPYVPDFYGPSEQTDHRTIEIGIGACQQKYDLRNAKRMV